MALPGLEHHVRLLLMDGLEDVPLEALAPNCGSVDCMTFCAQVAGQLVQVLFPVAQQGVAGIAE